MIRLVCVSSTPNLLTQDDLVDILRTNAHNHERNQITGLLVYHSGDILQVLEGPEDLVDEVMDRALLNDGGKINVLLREDIEQRLFDRWSMSFSTSENLGPEDQEHLSDFLERGHLPEPGESGAQAVCQMLRAFRTDKFKEA